METAERQALEDELQALLAQKEFEGAATLALRRYGPELLGFLVALRRDHDDAADVFSQLCEDVWRGLPGFASRSSVRTWLYTLARHAFHRALRSPARRKNVPLDEASAVSRIEHEVRVQTLSFLRTASRSRLTELREALPAEDQMLLILRVDKQLGWSELAGLMHDGQPLSDDDLKREAARLRKRFQLLKDRLREQARAEGLIDGPE
jgi:RNA polymerase sigma-70 factor (ECF subfamily)